MKASRKFKGRCENCNKSICEEHTYSYVDGDNEAITRNSPYLCKKCYEEKYGVKILDEVDTFKNNLINTLITIQRNDNIETIKINKLIEYLKN